MHHGTCRTEKAVVFLLEISVCQTEAVMILDILMLKGGVWAEEGSKKVSILGNCT